MRHDVVLRKLEEIMQGVKEECPLEIQQKVLTLLTEAKRYIEKSWWSDTKKMMYALTLRGRYNMDRRQDHE